MVSPEPEIKMNLLGASDFAGGIVKWCNLFAKVSQYIRSLRAILSEPSNLPLDNNPPKYSNLGQKISDKNVHFRIV